MSSQKIALVTGANKGIGFETVRQLAKQGIRVLLAARDPKKAAEAASKLEKEGLPVEPIALDVTSKADIFAATKSIEAKYGKLDILVNNAGIQVESSRWDINNSPDISPDHLRQTFDTNFFGAIEVTQALLPLLKKSDAGRIVNLSSNLASAQLHATPGSSVFDSKLVAYNVSKQALNGYTIHLAHALKDTPIKVNSAHPGWVKTDMGGDDATLAVSEGARTSVELALLPANGPSGTFVHLGKTIPW